jgi:hypothetical protein
MKMAAISWTWLLKILMAVLGPLFALLTPVIKAALTEFLTNLYKDCLATPNPYDDLVVGMLLDILGIPRPPVPS